MPKINNWGTKFYWNKLYLKTRTTNDKISVKKCQNDKKRKIILSFVIILCFLCSTILSFVIIFMSLFCPLSKKCHSIIVRNKLIFCHLCFFCYILRGKVVVPKTTLVSLPKLMCYVGNHNVLSRRS